MTQKEKKVFRHEPDHWVSISIDSITDQRLDCFDRCLLMYMTFRFNYMQRENLPYFESTQTLADVFDVHRNTVSKAIQKFKEIGYISVMSKTGGSNTYTKVTTWLNGVTPRKKDDAKQVIKSVGKITHIPVNNNNNTPLPNLGDSDDDPF